jgi:hypothetical protein
MRLTRSVSILTIVFAATMMIAACDDKSSATENTAAVETAPQAGDELPVAGASESSMPPLEESVEAPTSSVSEGSPGGEAVTEQELPPQSDVPPPPREVFQDAECSFESWVGQPVDEAAIKATDRPYRILKPGSMMTMDHNPQRINVEHDDANTVTRVWCG